MSEYPQGECKSCDELAARIQEMEEALRQLLKQWREPVGKAGGKRAWLKQKETMGEARGWISTKDQLPPVGVYVLCYHTASTWHSSDQEGVHYRVYMRVKDEYCEAGYRWEEFGPGGKFAEEVTHWMPLPARPADAPPAKEVEARISMTLAEYRSLAIPADEAAQAEVGKLPLMARREWMPAGFNYAGVDPNGRWSFLIGYPGDLLQGCSWFRIADTDEHGLPVIERTSDMPAWAKFIAWDGYDGMAWLYAEMPQRHPWNRVWRMSKGAQPFPVKYPSLRGEFSGRWDKSARRIEDYKGEQSC